jgi:hypothetical protein
MGEPGANDVAQGKNPDETDHRCPEICAMNFREQENRLILRAWVSDLRSSVTQFEGKLVARSLPKNPKETVARLEEESASTAPAVERAISQFSRSMRWPANLSGLEYFYIQVRVLCACRLIDLILAGEVTNPDIIRFVGSDKANFTKWMLTAAWDQFGESYLRTLFGQPIPPEFL